MTMSEFNPSEPNPFSGKLSDTELMAWSTLTGEYIRISVRALTEEIALEVLRQLNRELESKEEREADARKN
jgi:hypothetical protein